MAPRYKKNHQNNHHRQVGTTNSTTSSSNSSVHRRRRQSHQQQHQHYHSSNPQQQHVLATIDLHGYRKEEAIRRLTDFLEVWRNRATQNKTKFQSHRHPARQADDGNGWVCVITGTGQHSHDGPVLRDAVYKLLQKRQMDCIVQRGKASVLVNVLSGFQLYAAEAQTDTKVIVVPSSSSSSDVRLIGRAPPNSLSSSIISNRQIHQQQYPHLKESAPSSEALSKRQKQQRALRDKPAHQKQLEEDAELVERIKQQSQEELERKERKSNMKDQRTMEKALRLSQEEALQDALKEEELLRRAMVASEKEEAMYRSKQRSDDVNEEEELQRALQESQRMIMSSSSSLLDEEGEVDLELAIQQAMEASLAMQEVSSSSSGTTREEAMLQEALKLSLQEQQSTTVASSL